ncbi:MAG: tryptophan synthase subunit alpha [Deltaproteobacteria bacterium]|nr:tryptophan synthase subunit alpha [Deltaproteobacteria bacterium]
MNTEKQKTSVLVDKLPNVLDRTRALLENQKENEVAFIPFVTLGDPDLAISAKILRVLIEAGADALEVGLPFSDPIADGPVIQAASKRALAAGVTPKQAFALIRELRDDGIDLPVGLLTYANLVVSPGMQSFYESAKEAGIDSVLVADVPIDEAVPFSNAARTAGIAPVLIAPFDLGDEEIQQLALLADGYTYCVARDGVTGSDAAVEVRHDALFEKLTTNEAPPPVIGFGISTPEHVRTFAQAGARGVISGSAVVRIIASHLDESELMLEELRRFVQAMKAATHS